MRCDGVSINDNKLGGFNFHLEKTLEAHRDIKDMKLKLLLGNHDSNDNLDFDFCFIFSQIA